MLAGVYTSLRLFFAFFGVLSVIAISFRIADNPSGKGRKFDPSHIALNAANGIETKGHVAPRGKNSLSCETRQHYRNREEHHGI